MIVARHSLIRPLRKATLVHGISERSAFPSPTSCWARCGETRRARAISDATP
jgi:hypothetical protein